MNGHDGEPGPKDVLPDGQAYAAYLRTSQDYYLKHFRTFTVDGFRVTWNRAAFLLPFAWPAYRRMYGWTVVAPLLFVILYWTSIIKEYEYSAVTILLCSLFLPGLLFGPIGNYLYFLKVRSALRRRFPAAAEQIEPDVSTTGAAASIILVWGAALIYLGASVPGFVAYRVRAYDARAVADLNKCREGLDYFYGDRTPYSATPEEAPCDHDPRVMLNATKLAKGKFALTAAHAKGSKEYQVRSDESGVFVRAKGSGQEWVEQR